MSRPAKLFIITLCVLSGSSCFSEARLVCELGSFSKGSNECLSCHSSCVSCSGPSAEECTSCGLGRVLNPDGTCLCVAGTLDAGGRCDGCSECAKGEYEKEACSSSADTECGPCYSKCAECSGPNDNECTACETGRFLNTDGQCEDCGSAMCAADEYETEACTSHADVQCGDCHPDCAGCTGPKNNDCTACDSDLIFHTGGRCLSFVRDMNQTLGSDASRAVELADLDGDGYPDAFVANNGANTVWFNDGTGHFTGPVQSLGDANSADAQLQDLDGDGDLDVFVANEEEAGWAGPNRVWLNDGAGSFTDSGQLLGVSNSQELRLADLDGDNDVDAVVAKLGQPAVVWLNDGTGQFTLSGKSLGYTGYAVQLGDLDGDNDVDVYVGNIGGGGEVLLNDGNGNFVGVGTVTGDVVPKRMALGDLDNDGDLDVAVVCVASAECTSGEIHQNTNGAGSLQKMSDSPFSDGTQDVKLADLNGDSYLDAVTAKLGANEVWFNDNGNLPTAPSWTFSLGQSFGTGQSYGIQLADLDGDDDVDAFVANDGANRVWLNDAGTFNGTAQTLGSADSRGVALFDIDGDTDLDAVVANYGGPDRVWLNDGAGQFTDSGQSLGNDNSNSVGFADVNNDTHLDAVFANSAGGDKVWLNNGTGQFASSGQALFHGVNRSVAVKLGDVDTDGDLDAVVANSAGGDKVWLNDGAGNFSDSGQSLLTTFLSDGEPMVAETSGVDLADVDGDGDLDALIGHADSDGAIGRNAIWLNDGAGNFSDSGQSLANLHTNTVAVKLGDFDGDNDFDAYIVNRGSASGGAPNKVWLNDGDGNFSDSNQSLGTGNSGNVALADIDGDGDLDAIVANDSTEGTIWLNDGLGHFVEQAKAIGNIYGVNVALADIDVDGDLDAFLVTNGPNEVWRLQ